MTATKNKETQLAELDIKRVAAGLGVAGIVSLVAGFVGGLLVMARIGRGQTNVEIKK